MNITKHPDIIFQTDNQLLVWKTIIQFETIHLTEIYFKFNDTSDEPIAWGVFDDITKERELFLKKHQADQKFLKLCSSLGQQMTVNDNPF
jgi:hypothetical protein